MRQTSASLQLHVPCRQKLAALKQTGDPMSFRAAEATARPKAVDNARQLLELIQKSSNAWPTIKPWLNETDIKGLTEQVSWLISSQLLVTLCVGDCGSVEATCKATKDRRILASPCHSYAVCRGGDLQGSKK